MRGQNLSRPLNNMLIGVITSTMSPWGIIFSTPYEQYVDWGNNIIFIFIRDQNLPTPYEQYVDWGNNINFICMRDQNSATPYEQYFGWGNNINFIFMATWSHTRSNGRVAANMFKDKIRMKIHVGQMFPSFGIVLLSIAGAPGFPRVLCLTVCLNSCHMHCDVGSFFVL